MIVTRREFNFIALVFLMLCFCVGILMGMIRTAKFQNRPENHTSKYYRPDCNCKDCLDMRDLYK